MADQSKTSVNQGENIRIFQGSDFETASDKDLLEQDASVFLHQALSSPVFKSVTKVEGAYLYDGEGNKLLDLHGNGVHTVGYNNPYVLKALKDQLESGLTFAPRRFTNVPAVELAEKLVEIAPKELSRVLLCPGGSEAIEMAIMLARHHTRKWKTLSFKGTFHGAGFQAISVGADPHFTEGLGPLMPGALHLELPDYYRNPWGYTDQVKIDNAYIEQFEKVADAHDDIAAFITEPVFYNSTVPTAYYWQSIREICEDHGILLIFDEIYTAFGRTGKMFASDHFVSPDILVVGKGFGGGIVPFAGIIAREELNTVAHKSIGHYTHEKSPLCSTVAKAVIDYVEDYNLVEDADELGALFRAGLEKLQKKFKLIGEVKGLGLNLAVDLVKDRKTKTRATKKAHKLMVFCLKKGVSFKLIQGNTLNLKPALVITEKEIHYILKVLEEGFEYLQRSEK